MNTTALLPALLAAFLVSCATSTQTAGNQNGSPSSSSPHGNGPIATLIAAGPSRIELIEAEQDLYDLIMQYRRENGLPTIPMSKSLSLVAKLHVRDLERNAVTTPYNFHSWSQDGPWRAVNYTPDHRYAKLMWSKPRELTNYPGNGYEIVYMNTGSASSRDAFSIWKSSNLHNAVIINERDWKRTQWRAIGIGIYGRYAAVWFGEEIDPDT